MLSRRFGESIVIEHRGEILRISFDHHKDEAMDVRLRFEGPKSFQISRGPSIPEKHRTLKQWLAAPDVRVPDSGTEMVRPSQPPGSEKIPTVR